LPIDSELLKMRESSLQTVVVSKLTSDGKDFTVLDSRSRTKTRDG
jgi:hypothetical protein